MLTSRIWWDFQFDLKYKAYNGYCVEDNKIAWKLLLTILGTPFTIILDILFAPVEIIYYVCLRIVKKLRK